MHPIIEAQKHELMAICSQLGVRRLELFGSAARDDFDASRSDLDFLVELAGARHVSPLDEYFELKDRLESLFRRPVDLISLGSPIRNPYVRAEIERDRVKVYPE